jgi:hypothetical protein
MTNSIHLKLCSPTFEALSQPALPARLDDKTRPSRRRSPTDAGGKRPAASECTCRWSSPSSSSSSSSLLLRVRVGRLGPARRLPLRSRQNFKPSESGHCPRLVLTLLCFGPALVCRRCCCSCMRSVLRLEILLLADEEEGSQSVGRAQPAQVRHTHSHVHSSARTRQLSAGEPAHSRPSSSQHPILMLARLRRDRSRRSRRRWPASSGEPRRQRSAARGRPCKQTSRHDNDNNDDAR